MGQTHKVYAKWIWPEPVTRFVLGHRQALLWSMTCTYYTGIYVWHTYTYTCLISPRKWRWNNSSLTTKHLSIIVVICLGCLGPSPSRSHSIISSAFQLHTQWRTVHSYIPPYQQYHILLYTTYIHVRQTTITQAQAVPTLLCSYTHLLPTKGTNECKEN